MMRYYWGFAIGHTYAHDRHATTFDTSSALDPNQDHSGDHIHDIVANLEEPDATTGEEPEFSLVNLDDDLQTHEEEPEEGSNQGSIDGGDIDSHLREPRVMFFEDVLNH